MPAVRRFAVVCASLPLSLSPLTSSIHPISRDHRPAWRLSAPALP
ncbi:MAG: hypothetical protein ACTHMA_01930 [Thermomicrobiales bacterium]